MNDTQPIIVPDDLQEAPAEDREVPCGRLIGCAGTGKTTTLIERTKRDKNYGLLSSTTGVSAVNLGAITWHSELRVSDTLSLRDAYLTGRLKARLHAIGKEYRYLVIEEYSMLHGDQLDFIYRGVVEANRYSDMEHPLGILLVGDLAQLPPVKGRWCFTADCWSRFAGNTERLTHVWRQNGGLFLDSLNLLRTGNGRGASDCLRMAGAVAHTQLDTEFDGTTILSKREMVGRYNALALGRVHGRPFTVHSFRWGAQRREWSQNPKTHEWGIPPRIDLKIGALVMCLSNRSDFSVVNGDTGHIRDWDGLTGIITVDLLRTGKPVEIYPIVRGVEDQAMPYNWKSDAPELDEDTPDWFDMPHYRKRTKRYVSGQIKYYPLQLAWATTVHKSQSLTLDRVQVDFRDKFFSSPAMLYVSLSRCRSLEGLRLVGSFERFATQCSIDSRVLPWL
jgi:ATP-dependent DNA helicase PIF1